MKYNIISKFIKDLSFEIPSAEAYVMLDKEISKYNLVFDVTSKQFKKNIIEVNTILKLIANDQVKKKIHVEINITALVSVEGDLNDKISLEKIILVNVPTDVYPTLYDTFIFLFSNSEIKNININKKIDFEKLYNEKNK